MFLICTAMSSCYDRFPNVIQLNVKCPKSQDNSSGQETIRSSAMTIRQMSKRQKTSGLDCEFLLFQKKVKNLPRIPQTFGRTFPSQSKAFD